MWNGRNICKQCHITFEPFEWDNIVYCHFRVKKKFSDTSYDELQLKLLLTCLVILCCIAISFNGNLIVPFYSYLNSPFKFWYRYMSFFNSPVKFNSVRYFSYSLFCDDQFLLQNVCLLQQTSPTLYSVNVYCYWA